MRPTVAIDCDSVLVDNCPVWAAYFKRRTCGKHDTSVEVPYTSMYWDFWQDWCRSCWSDVLHKPEVIFAHVLRRGVKPRLRLLSQAADLVLVTSRPEDTLDATKSWLTYSEIGPFFKQVVLTKKKRPVCESLGAVALLDDAPRNIEAIQESQTVQPVIFDMPYNRHIDGPVRVHDWNEAYIALHSIIRARELGEPGLSLVR